jgi:hypothetical protein
MSNIQNRLKRLEKAISPKQRVFFSWIATPQDLPPEAGPDDIVYQCSWASRPETVEHTFSWQASKQ